MNREIIKNIIFVVIGAVLLGIVEFKVLQITEIIALIIGFIGFMVLIDGIFGLYNTIKKEPEDLENIPQKEKD